MKVLVTASSGHLGATIAGQLSLQSEVVGLDLIPGPVTAVQGSVADAALLASVAESCNGIIHTVGFRPEFGVESLLHQED